MIPINEAALTLSITKAEECAKEIEKILDIVYKDIKNTPIFKKIRTALVEASKKLIKMKSEKISKEGVRNYNQLINQIKEMTKEIDNGSISEGAERVHGEVCKKIANQNPDTVPRSQKNEVNIICNHLLTNHTFIEPSWNVERKVVEIPIQDEILLRVNETKIIDLGIELSTQKGFYADIEQAEGWDQNKKIIINTNLIKNKFEDGEKISIQNVTEGEIKIGRGTILTVAKIRQHSKAENQIEWEEFEERNTQKKRVRHREGT
jgi:hypothetical protein